MTTSTIHPLEQIAAEFDKGESRGPAVMLDLINQYYTQQNKKPISHLDDISSRYATRPLSDILGSNYKDTRSLQSRLVELKIFSPKIEDYSLEVQEQIIGYILNKPGQRHISFYLASDLNPHAEINRKLVATSKQFKDYLSGKGITHPDSITKSTKLLENVLGAEHNGVTEIRNNLIIFGTFPAKIDEYEPEIQDEIIKGAIKTKWLDSSFLSEDNPFAEYNRNIVASSQIMKDHLLGLGIDHLDSISYKSKFSRDSHLASLLGFDVGRDTQMRQRLIELGHYSLDMSQYTEEVQENIIGSMLERMTHKGFSSVYLGKDSPYLESNRRIIATSQHVRAYLTKIGVKHLDDIEKTTPTTGFGSVLGGFKHNQPKNMQRRLVELGIFSPNLSDSSYDSLREDISQKLVDNVSTPKPSYYTSPDLDETILQSNRDIILASNAVQRFFAGQRYDMNNPGTMNNKVSLFFKKYFGTDDPDIFIVSRTKEEDLPLYRRIHKEWTADEEGYLIQEFERVGRDETRFVDMIHSNRVALQEQFGVSYRAIIEKSKYMGLISSDETGGTRDNGIPVYAFPQIHSEEFPDELEGFENYATLLANGIIPGATPAFAFTSAAKEEFDAVTVPVWYKGPDPDSYTIAAQRVLSAVQHYLSDNSRFETRENGDIEIDPSTPHEMSPRMLQIEGEHHNLVQLIFRKRFNPDNKIGTTAIDTGNGRDIYVFQHELTPTYDNTRQHKS